MFHVKHCVHGGMPRPRGEWRCAFRSRIHDSGALDDAAAIQSRCWDAATAQRTAEANAPNPLRSFGSKSWVDHACRCPGTGSIASASHIRSTSASRESRIEFARQPFQSVTHPLPAHSIPSPPSTAASHCGCERKRRCAPRAREERLASVHADSKEEALPTTELEPGAMLHVKHLPKPGRALEPPSTAPSSQAVRTSVEAHVVAVEGRDTRPSYRDAPSVRATLRRGRRPRDSGPRSGHASDSRQQGVTELSDPPSQPPEPPARAMGRSIVRASSQNHFRCPPAEAVA